MATREQWEELGKALGIIIAAFIIFLTLIYFALATVHASIKSFPDSWKSCTDMKPVPGADDGSQAAICTDDDDKRYDIVYRSIHKECLPEVDAKDKRSDYQHFLCEEKWELMIRPFKAASK